MARTVQIKFVADTKKADESIQGFERRFKSAIDGSTSNVGKLRSALGGLGTAIGALASVAAFKQISQFAIDLDKSRNAMTALTGSVEAANKKLAELRELAKASPGVTNTFAQQLFNQLKAIGGISDQTINNVIKSLGKLSTVFSDVGPDFARNLVQIFQQGFERGDIKEALGRVPIFEQLLKSAFGTDDPEKLRKLKESGKLTLDAFVTGFSNAIQTDPRLKNVQESLGGRIQKALDETKLKLAETGEKILQVLLPALDKLLPVVNSLLDAFKKLPEGLQLTVLGIAALAPAISPAVAAVRTLTTAFIGLSTAMQASLGIAGLVLVGGALAFQGLQDTIARNEASLQAQLNQGRLDLSGKPIFAEVPKGVKPLTGKLDLSPLGVFDEATGRFGPAKPPSAGVLSGLGGGKSRAASEREQEIAEMTKKIAEARDEFGKGVVEDLEAIEKVITAANIQGGLREREIAGRPAQLAGFNAALAERIRQTELETLRLEENTAKKAREELEKIQPILSNSERFMRGFAAATESVGDAFERFGENVSRVFANVRDLFNGLKQAVLGFFNDLLGNALQNIVRSTLGGLFGQIGGGLGNLFRTPTFAQAFAGGSGITAPPSISGGGLGSIFSGIFGGGSSGTGRSATLSGGLGDFIGASVPRTAGKIGGGFFSGIGQSLAAAAPLVGLSLGSGLGGQSVLGQIAGSAGGLLGGGAIAGFSGVLGAKAAAFFTNPFTIAIGAGLLVGSIFLGRAAQRRKDEEASGQFLTQALQGIEELAAGVASGQIPGAQARSIFETQILGTFRQQIGQLKTASVRESRLTNQVNDLRKVFEARIPPLIAEQERKAADAARFAAIDSRLVPQFAGGGTVPGIDRGRDSVLAMLRPGEKVLTLPQQASVISQSNPSVFDRAGVPRTAMRVGAAQAFQLGGTAQPSSFASPVGSGSINLFVQLGMTEKDSQQLVARAFDSRTGEEIVVNAVQRARGRGRNV